MCLVLSPLIKLPFIYALHAALSSNNVVGLTLMEGVHMILEYIESSILVIYIHDLLHELI